MGGGAWPFLVGGVICLVDSDNERDSCLVFGILIVLVKGFIKPQGDIYFTLTIRLLIPHTGTDGKSSRTRKSNNRSVMPLDVLGCTRATLKRSACFYGLLVI